MATIIKRGDRYSVRVRRTGFAPISRTFANLADAKEWARDKERDADRGDLGPRRDSLRTTTLKQLVERYRDDVVPTKKGAAVETIVLNAFLRHDICKRPLSDLTTADFAKYRDERLKSIKPQSLKRQLTPLVTMLTIAQTEWGVPLRENPLAGLRLDASDNRRERRLQAEELDRIVLAAEKTRNPYILLIVRFALETAMRRGEILALRFANIDSQRSTATIVEAKNGSGRVVPLTPTALSIIEAAKTIKKARPSDRVFSVSVEALKLGWQRLVDRAKVPDLHLHDLRHEAISRLFEAGLTMPEVASISGHKTISQLSRYSHANNSSVRAKLGIVDENIATLPE